VPVCLIAFLAGIVMVSGCDRAAHYRKHNDGKSLYATLHKQIKSGNTIEEVQKLLGSGKPPGEPDKLLAAMKKAAARYLEIYPDGIQEDDVFVGYSIGKRVTLYLQFRDGRLVNHMPERYAKYEPVELIR
jgi:hypothetical protein